MPVHPVPQASVPVSSRLATGVSFQNMIDHGVQLLALSPALLEGAESCIVFHGEAVVKSLFRSRCCYSQASGYPPGVHRHGGLWYPATGKMPVVLAVVGSRNHPNPLRPVALNPPYVLCPAKIWVKISLKKGEIGSLPPFAKGGKRGILLVSQEANWLF